MVSFNQARKGEEFKVKIVKKSKFGNQYKITSPRGDSMHVQISPLKEGGWILDYRTFEGKRKLKEFKTEKEALEFAKNYIG